MDRVGIPLADQEAIFRTVASILHIGNISFQTGPDESSLVKAGAAEAHLGVTGTGVWPPHTQPLTAGYLGCMFSGANNHYKL